MDEALSTAEFEVRQVGLPQMQCAASGLGLKVSSLYAVKPLHDVNVFIVKHTW